MTDAKDVNIVRVLMKAKSGYVLEQGDGLLLHDEVMRLSAEVATLTRERDALRKRAAAAEAESEALLSVLERVKPNIHIDAALAVQP
jgi:uncharacterized protein YlxW (UPF0749 family)